jgi:hypothetical protein
MTGVRKAARAAVDYPSRRVFVGCVFMPLVHNRTLHKRLRFTLLCSMPASAVQRSDDNVDKTDIVPTPTR